METCKNLQLGLSCLKIILRNQEKNSFVKNILKIPKNAVTCKFML